MGQTGSRRVCADSAPKQSTGSTGKTLAVNVGGTYWQCPRCYCTNRHSADQYGKFTGSRKCDRCGNDYDLN